MLAGEFVGGEDGFCDSAAGEIGAVAVSSCICGTVETFELAAGEGGIC